MLTSYQQPILPKKHVLVPKGQVGQTSRNIVDRMKHPKLVGADVYVARLATNSPAPFAKPKPAPSSASAEVVPTPTGSLHDELTCKTSPNTIHMAADDAPCRSAVDSRPCYRCVCYMNSVGIKRVFWTNSKGKWEGAKIRDLVDMLDGSGSESDGVAGLGVFVTKHEVLMLRRLFKT